MLFLDGFPSVFHITTRRPGRSSDESTLEHAWLSVSEPAFPGLLNPSLTRIWHVLGDLDCISRRSVFRIPTRTFVVCVVVLAA